MYKVVKSAMHNAAHNEGADLNNLIISEVLIGRGPKIKRMRFASRSRMHGYVKHRSYVQVTVSEK
jgi:large subunit ribosomal protein L22